MQEQIQRISQDTAGKILVGAGGTGSAAQYVMDGLNYFIMGGNALLVAGGVYLMYHKIFKKGD